MNIARPSTPVPAMLFALIGSFAVLLAGLAIAGTADAAAKPSGSAQFTIGTGKTGNALREGKIDVFAIKQAVRSSPKHGITRVTAPVSSLKLAGKSFVGLRGSIQFKRGKRKINFSGLKLTVKPNGTVVKARSGKGRIVLFTASGKAGIDTVESKLSLTGAKLSLSRVAAKKIRRKLRLRKLPAGNLGRLSLSARQPKTVPPVDPYLEQCGLAATSKRLGSVASATPLPVLTNPVATTGEPIAWSFKYGLNMYVGGIGSIETLDGVVASSILGPGPGAPPNTLFTFPTVAGQYAANEVGPADDQAILNGSGTVVYCNEPHGFRVAISNPTVVIDGANSRIIADLDTNITGEWTPTQRVDFMDLDLSGVTAAEHEPGKIEWPAIPTKLSQTGLDALRFCDISITPGAPPSCLYPLGTAFDTITVSAATVG